MKALIIEYLTSGTGFQHPVAAIQVFPDNPDAGYSI